jgi:hypothetical protein
MDRRGFLGLLGMAGVAAAIPKTLRAAPAVDTLIDCDADKDALRYGPCGTQSLRMIPGGVRLFPMFQRGDIFSVEGDPQMYVIGGPKVKRRGGKRRKPR